MKIRNRLYARALLLCTLLRTEQTTSKLSSVNLVGLLHSLIRFNVLRSKYWRAAVNVKGGGEMTSLRTSVD